MGAKIGLIQSGSIGDIIIALPIADYYLERGLEVVWPIHESFFPFFHEAKPQVTFIPLSPQAGEIDYDVPMQLLKERGCEPIFSLYSYIASKVVYDQRLTWSLKFDEYKYAVAKVPFARKWELRLNRNHDRERRLHDSLGITGPYLCVHDTGGSAKADFALPAAWSQSHQVVKISPLTDNPFDWIYTLEHAARLVLLDSCFANLVEQLNFPNTKHLLLRSPTFFTPVYKSGWTFHSFVDPELIRRSLRFER